MRKIIVIFVCGVVKWICCGVCVERSDEYLCMGIFELIFVGLLLYLVVFIYIFFFKDYSDYLCKLYFGFFGILCRLNLNNVLLRFCGCYLEILIVSCKFFFLF